MIKPLFLLPTTIHPPYHYRFWHVSCAAIRRSRFAKEAEVCFRNVLRTNHTNHTSRTHQTYTTKTIAICRTHSCYVPALRTMIHAGMSSSLH